MSGVIILAQHKTSGQQEVLCIQSVKYNLIDIDAENWPFNKIYKSEVHFQFGTQKFRIVNSTKFNEHSEYEVADQNGSYLLSYNEGNEYIEIHFSKYTFTCSHPINGQSDKDFTQASNSTLEEGIDSVPAPIPYQRIDKMPEFKKGDATEFSKWVNKNLVYPKIAKANGIEGCVILQFTVGYQGEVKDVAVLKGANPYLDEEAVRVVKDSPKWTPGEYYKKPINVTYTYPVVFRLTE